MVEVILHFSVSTKRDMRSNQRNFFRLLSFQHRMIIFGNLVFCVFRTHSPRLQIFKSGANGQQNYSQRCYFRISERSAFIVRWPGATNCEDQVLKFLLERIYFGPIRSNKVSQMGAKFNQDAVEK